MNDILTKEVKCLLTQEELLDYSKQLAKNQQDKYEAESHKKSVVADCNDKIARLDSEMHALSRKINSGYEYRMTKCQYVFDWERLTKTLIRIDTGEIVDIRPVTDEDKQQSLNMEV